MALIQVFLDYYDANLPELQAAYQKQVEEQQHLAAEEKANPKVPEDITVQYRILDPEEIVTPATSEK